MTPLPKRGFGPPLVRYVFHPPQVSVLCFSFTKIHDRADQKFFLEGSKNIRESALSGTFTSPHTFCTPPYHGPNCDASFALGGGKSRSGILILLVDEATSRVSWVSWQSRRQTLIALSAPEAEAVALSEALYSPRQNDVISTKIISELFRKNMSAQLQQINSPRINFISTFLSQQFWAGFGSGRARWVRASPVSALSS